MYYVVYHCVKILERASMGLGTLLADIAHWLCAIVEVIVSQPPCLEHVAEGSCFKSGPTRKQLVGQELGVRFNL